MDRAQRIAQKATYVARYLLRNQYNNGVESVEDVSLAIVGLCKICQHIIISIMGWHVMLA